MVFCDQRTERVFRRQRVKGLSREVQRAALRKLLILDAADSLGDLRVPPGNRLGQYSIRVNDQWRICFVWSRGDASEVEVADYH